MHPIPRFVPPLTLRECLNAVQSRNSIVPLQKFTEAFARYIGVKHAVIVPSARVGLAAVLHALELPKDGQVILPGLTFHSIPAQLNDIGLEPHFVDIDPGTYCMDSSKLASAINEKTVAILPVHLYGRASPMGDILELAKSNRLIVIEDCAQACGAMYNGHRLGSLGKAGFFSFGPTKNLSTLWGGMVTTNDTELARRVQERIRHLQCLNRWELFRRAASAMAMRLATHHFIWKVFGSPVLSILASLRIDPIEWLTSEVPGHTDSIDKDAQRMPRSFQGKLGLSQLTCLDESNRSRIRNGNRLLERLKDLKGIDLPASAPDDENIFVSFVVRVNARQGFRRRLLRLGIDSHAGNIAVGPELPGMQNRPCPVAADAAARMVHLPVFPDLSETDIDRIADAVIQSLK